MINNSKLGAIQLLNLIEINDKNKGDLIRELTERQGNIESEVESSVEKILLKVKKSGDKALFNFTE